MAKTPTAAFAQTPKTGTAVAVAALSGLSTDTVSGAVLLVTAGAEGAIVTKVTAMPRATVTVTSLALFLVKASAPTVYRIIDSELLPTYAASTSTAIPETVFNNITEQKPLRLEAGDKIYAGSQAAVSSGVIFYAEWTDY